MSSFSTALPTRILACTLCQHRKIKCDRSFPCATCVKAKVACTPSTPAPVRRRRRPNQDLQERLARCEKLLEEYAVAKPESPSTQRPSVQAGDDQLRWKPAGKLVVEEDGGIRFMESFLIGTVQGELRAMREIIDGDDIEDVGPATFTSPDANVDLILGGIMPEISLEALWPSPGHMIRLWQIYLERVNPLTKIVHVPTLQPYLLQIAAGSQDVPQSMEALFFAIFTFASVALSPDECISLLGCSKETALQRFSCGVRAALSRLGVLENYDLVALQGLLIYLISLESRYNEHASWILSGTVIRIAQKMGLHRDGESLGLSPFETEMRRRIWWQIIMVDAKYAMRSGLSHSFLPRGWDTKEPMNVNDADLFASATEPTQDCDGPTEMIMVLLINKFTKFFVDSPCIEPALLFNSASDTLEGPNAPTNEQKEACRQLMKDLALRQLEIIDKYCDPSIGPVHDLAFGTKEDSLDKIRALSSRPQDSAATPNDHAFMIAVRKSEKDVGHHVRIRDKGFAWFSRFFFQVNIFRYMVGQLCYRTSDDLVERAWEVVQSAYDAFPELFDVTQKSYYQLATSVLKAWRIRKEVLRLRLGAIPKPPDYVAIFQGIMPQEELRTELSARHVTEQTSLDGMSRTLSAVTIDRLPPSHVDVNTLDWDWDRWGNMVPADASMTAFGGFGLSGPSAEIRPQWSTWTGGT